VTLAIALSAVAAGCGGAAGLPASRAPSAPAAEAPAGSPVALPSPAATTSYATPSPTAAASLGPAPARTTPPATPTASARSSATPRPTPAEPTAGSFWALVEDGVREARRVEVEIAGPNAGTLRFQATASATVIEGVVGFVCTGGRAYDGQSGFTTLPGKWTCGVKALTAGFRAIGQPADAWSSTIPTDRNRRESVVEGQGTWTWRYSASSPYLGGAVAATVTLDRATGRITAARRTDPTGTTRYSFQYEADFPPITVPR
jgi:hypothetical protein